MIAVVPVDHEHLLGRIAITDDSEQLLAQLIGPAPAVRLDIERAGGILGFAPAFGLDEHTGSVEQEHRLSSKR